MTDRLLEVIAQILGVSQEHLSEQDSPDTIESWDSMTHIHLILALETEFNVSISADEAAEMLSVGLIRKVMNERVALK